jgi:hypothetical protein
VIVLARKVKCQECLEKQEFNEESMTFIEKVSDSGRKTRKYFHTECLNKYNEKQEFLDKEQKLLDELVEVAGDIHEAPKPPNMSYQMPRVWYHMIQDIRNGTNRYTRGFKKKYKKGIPYSIIIRAYKMSKDAIKWSKMDKQFKEIGGEVRYGLAVVSNKIPDALKKAEREEHAEKIARAKQEKMMQEQHEEREVSYKKKKSSYDISDFLD